MMLKCSHEFYKMWDTHFTVPTFEFYFKFPIPKPNKERIIFERDRLGKIKSSKCLKGLYYKEFNTVVYDFEGEELKINKCP